MKNDTLKIKNKCSPLHQEVNINLSEAILVFYCGVGWDGSVTNIYKYIQGKHVTNLNILANKWFMVLPVIMY